MNLQVVLPQREFGSSTIDSLGVVNILRLYNKNNLRGKQRKLRIESLLTNRVLFHVILRSCFPRKLTHTQQKSIQKNEDEENKDVTE